MRYFIIAAALLIFAKSVAQTNIAALSLQAGFPQGDYKENYPVTSSGLLFGIVHILKGQPPFSVGGEVGIMQVSGSNKNYTGIYNNEYNTFVVASWNHIVTMSALLKVNLPPYSKSCNVYVDFRIGTNLFLTTTSISRNDGRDYIANTAKIKFYYSDAKTSFTLRLGAGLGVDVPFGRKKNMAFMAECSYLYGSPAKYYAKPCIDDLQITLAPKQSATSMLLAETGINFGIFNKKNKS